MNGAGVNGTIEDYCHIYICDNLGKAIYLGFFIIV